MDFNEAQKDMRSAYLGGGPGVMISGLVWISAGITAIYFSNLTSIIVFFIAGMFIHPLGIIVTKLFNRRGKHLKTNPLGKLAIESTIILFIGLFIVYTLYQTSPTYFYPIMLLIIGVRYLIFQSIYGSKMYWALGIVLMAIGIFCLKTEPSFYVTAIIGGLTELIFAALIFKSEQRTVS